MTRISWRIVTVSLNTGRVLKVHATDTSPDITRASNDSAICLSAWTPRRRRDSWRTHRTRQWLNPSTGKWCRFVA
jgi:hypothetical protein